MKNYHECEPVKQGVRSCELVTAVEEAQDEGINPEIARANEEHRELWNRRESAPKEVDQRRGVHDI